MLLNEKAWKDNNTLLKLRESVGIIYSVSDLIKKIVSKKYEEVLFPEFYQEKDVKYIRISGDIPNTDSNRENLVVQANRAGQGKNNENGEVWHHIDTYFYDYGVAIGIKDHNRLERDLKQNLSNWIFSHLTDEDRKELETLYTRYADKIRPFKQKVSSFETTRSTDLYAKDATIPANSRYALNFFMADLLIKGTNIIRRRFPDLRNAVAVISKETINKGSSDWGLLDKNEKPIHLTVKKIGEVRFYNEHPHAPFQSKFEDLEDYIGTSYSLIPFFEIETDHKFRPGSKYLTMRVNKNIIAKVGGPGIKGPSEYGNGPFEVNTLGIYFGQENSYNYLKSFSPSDFEDSVRDNDFETKAAEDEYLQELKDEIEYWEEEIENKYGDLEEGEGTKEDEERREVQAKYDEYMDKKPIYWSEESLNSLAKKLITFADLKENKKITVVYYQKNTKVKTYNSEKAKLDPEKIDRGIEKGYY